MLLPVAALAFFPTTGAPACVNILMFYIVLGFRDLDLGFIKLIIEYTIWRIYNYIGIILVFMLKVLLLPVAALAFLLLPVRIHIFPFFAPNNIYTDQENRKNKYNRPTLIWDSNPHLKIIHPNMMRTGIPRHIFDMATLGVCSKYYIIPFIP